MILNTFKAENLCQYKDMEFEFTPGILGFVGPNGIGKTNFMQGLLRSLIGDIYLSPQISKTNEELIRYGEEDFRTYLSVNFGETLCEIVRTSSKAELTVNEGETVTGITTCNARIEEYMHMPFDLFKEICFVPQKSLENFVICRHAERAKFFQKVCKLQAAEKIRSELQQAINDTPMYASRAEKKQELLDSIAEDKKQLKQLQKQLKSDRKKLEGTDTEAAEKLVHIQSESEKKSKISDLQVDMKTKQTELENLPEVREVPEYTPVTEEMRDTRSKWEKNREQKARMEGLEEELEKLADQLENLTQDPYKENIEKGNKWVKEQEYELILQEHIAESAKRGKCVICKSDFNLDPEELEARRSKLEKQVEQGRAKLEDYRKKNRKSNREYDRCVDQLNTLQKQLDKIDIQNVDHDEEKFCKFLKKQQEAEKIEKANRKAEQARKPLEKEVSTLEGKLEAVKEEDAVPDAEKEKARKTIADRNALQEEVHAEEVQVSKLETGLKSQQDQLEDIETTAKHNSKAEKEIKLLEECRDILHREQLPKKVIRRSVNRINREMVKYFKQFSLPFAAYIDSDLDFKVDYTQRIQNKSVTSLSGGQHVILAFIFRLALMDVFASSVPLLVLDEPTASLDETNSRKVAEMLEQARGYVESSMYILINTFEPILEQGFSRKVDVRELSDPVYHMNS